MTSRTIERQDYADCLGDIWLSESEAIATLAAARPESDPVVARRLAGRTLAELVDHGHVERRPWMTTARFRRADPERNPQ